MFGFHLALTLDLLVVLFLRRRDILGDFGGGLRVGGGWVLLAIVWRARSGILGGCRVCERTPSVAGLEGSGGGQRAQADWLSASSRSSLCYGAGEEGLHRWERREFLQMSLQREHQLGTNQKNKQMHASILR